MAAIEALGYRRNYAARALATNRSHRIGMIAANLMLYGPRAMATAVAEAGYEAGYDTALVGLPELSKESLAAAIHRLLGGGVEAVIVAVAHPEAIQLTQDLDLSIPVVVVQGVETDQLMAAGVDQVSGAVMATSHLLDLGRGPVAHVSGPLDWIEAAQRRTGWIMAHEERGLSLGREVPGSWSPASGYAAGRLVAADLEIHSVFVANDSMALGVLKALAEEGRRVPADVAVVGFDDIPDAAFFLPSLSSVRQDFMALGRSAVGLVVCALGGDPAPSTDLIAPILHVRASSAVAA